MKKISMFFVAVCLAVVSMAQISELTTINGQLILSYNNTAYTLNVSSEDESLNVLKIYDNNFQCVKTINNLNRIVFSGQNYGDCFISCLSKNVFTTSNKYEFIHYYQTYNTTTSSYEYHLKLYDEDMNVLYDFGNIDCLYGQFMFNKLILYDQNNKITKVYNIQGNVSNVPVEQVANMNKVYPNPANNIINIDYKINGKQMQRLDIMNISGKIVSTYLLDPYQNNLKVNVSSFEKGTYIYRYGNNSGKFIVE